MRADPNLLFDDNGFALETTSRLRGQAVIEGGKDHLHTRLKTSHWLFQKKQALVKPGLVAF